MNETIHPNSLSDVPWPTSNTRVPNTSMLPGSEKAPPAAVGMLKHAVEGAHDTIDRLADSAAPAVRKLGEGVTTVESALHERAAQLRATRDQWADGARTTVRDRPLVSMLAALVLGIVVGRLVR